MYQIKSKKVEHTNLADVNKEWARTAFPKSVQSAALKKANNEWVTGYNLDIGDDEVDNTLNDLDKC
mgnify:CR=1 FL=1